MRDLFRRLLHWLSSVTIPNLDVETSDHAAYTVTTSDHAGYAVTTSDHAAYTITLSDKTRGP